MSWRNRQDQTSYESAFDSFPRVRFKNATAFWSQRAYTRRATEIRGVTACAGRRSGSTGKCRSARAGLRSRARRVPPARATVKKHPRPAGSARTSRRRPQNRYTLTRVTTRTVGGSTRRSRPRGSRDRQKRKRKPVGPRGPRTAVRSARVFPPTTTWFIYWRGSASSRRADSTAWSVYSVGDRGVTVYTVGPDAVWRRTAFRARLFPPPREPRAVRFRPGDFRFSTARSNRPRKDFHSKRFEIESFLFLFHTPFREAWISRVRSGGADGCERNVPMPIRENTRSSLNVCTTQNVGNGASVLKRTAAYVVALSTRIRQ